MPQMNRPLALALILLLPFSAVSFAEETVGEKVESSAREGKTSTKKGWRKTKKKVRDATGNSSITEDTKDAAKNVGDSVSDTAKDVKNKVD